MNEKYDPEAGLTERKILRALVNSALAPDTESNWDPVWREFVFDAGLLTHELSVLTSKTGNSSTYHKHVVQTFAKDFAARYKLRTLRTDDISLPFVKNKLRVPRWFVGEAIGQVGINLLTTRYRAHCLGIEAAREVAYFGYGRMGEQLLPHPVALVRGALAEKQALYFEPIVLDEDGQALKQCWSIFDLLKADEYFPRQIENEAELSRYQEHLRDDPLGGAMITKLREFFSKRTTIGWRDATRWMLGSRHPWFDWTEAHKRLDESFEHFGTENFLTPRLTLFTPDLLLSDSELENIVASNQEVTKLFAQRLNVTLLPKVSKKLGRDALLALSEAALDTWHDNPDFNVEAANTNHFFANKISVITRALCGKEILSKKHNSKNLKLHFKLKGVSHRWLSELVKEENIHFFDALGQIIKEYNAQKGMHDEQGHTFVFQRVPMCIYTFYANPIPQPQTNERLLDSFSLAELQAPTHAHYLRTHPEIFAKLVVFFTLVLRHYFDTSHVVELKPKRLVRDLLLLGLWGTNAPNVIVSIYENNKTGKRKSIVRYVGQGQLKAYQADRERKIEGLGHLMFSQFGSVVEPSIFRSLSTFLMAAEESVHGNRLQQVGIVPFLTHFLEIFRESAHTTLKTTLVDLTTLVEILVDNLVDWTEQRLDHAASKLSRKK